MSRMSHAVPSTLLALFLLLPGCRPAPREDGSASVSTPPASSSDASSSADQSAQPDQSPAASTPEQQPDQSAQPEEPAVPEEPAQPETPDFDFTQCVPESEAVDLSYFDDAAFIGDSRTDGFMIYSGIGRGDNLTSNGLSIFKLAEKKALKIDGNSYTLLEALGLKQYGKVYLSLGINELGYYDDQGFYQAYLDAIDAIRAAQPNAIIYIQGLIPLNEQVIAQSGGASYLKNDHLRIYNDLMKKAAQEKQVAFLDLYTEFADANGALPADASKDGVHLKSDYCKQWLEYLQTHTVR